MVLDRPPATLNPRMTTDLSGQRIDELIYAALIKKDKNLKPLPDLAESWRLQNPLKLVFKMRDNATDQSGAAITAARMSSCLNEYVSGSPRAMQAEALPNVKAISSAGNEVVFELKKPDPYLLSNLTVFRYFHTGDPDHPCQEPKAGQTIAASGDYRPSRLGYDDLSPEREIQLVPVNPSAQVPLSIRWSFDDNSKTLQLLRGDADVLPTSLSLSKTRWLERAYPNRFRVIAPSKGVSVSYLQFNFKNSYLKNLDVRRAIALSIDRRSYVVNKMYGFGVVADSLLSPALDEYSGADFKFDPTAAEKLLDRAGYPRGKDGTRFTLHFKTTPIRDGFEMAEAFQAMLHRVGIELVLEVVEPAVFFASVKKGAFEMYTSRWVGIADASIFDRVLKTDGRDNRGAYSDAEIDAWLEQAMSEPDLSKRKAVFAKIQAKIAQDLPFLPLWFWTADAILTSKFDRRGGFRSFHDGITGAFNPFAISVRNGQASSRSDASQARSSCALARARGGSSHACAKTPRRRSFRSARRPRPLRRKWCFECVEENLASSLSKQSQRQQATLRPSLSSSRYSKATRWNGRSKRPWSLAHAPSFPCFRLTRSCSSRTKGLMRFVNAGKKSRTKRSSNADGSSEWKSRNRCRSKSF